MANFAVAASDEVINQGNRLLEKMALPGEKKADTLSRIFQIVSDNIEIKIVENIDTDFMYSDHNPVKLEFSIKK